MTPQAPWLSSAVRLLADNLNFLPAVGGAVEDLERPDEDERMSSLCQQQWGLVSFCQ